MILAISTALPQWFTKDGIASIRKDILFQSGLVAVEQGKIVGFLTYFVNQGIATIAWMGVVPNQHRSGIGTQLLQELRKNLLRHDVKSILVSTLGDAVDYEPYQRTRLFYRKNGFADFQKIQHPENPEQEEELILRSEI
ncbi:GNAT family N-acetyltransferase [Bdellovibrio bacteriovorus]|uniref:GNAT family N-acetyltransferase n=1 Tax=Bdellovibrio TaxID=958 RepID=UPI0035A880A0